MNTRSLLILSLVLAGCARTEPPPVQPAVPSFTAAPHANLAQLMRAIPFPHSNVLFDAQNNDPETAGEASLSNRVYAFGEATIYGGWTGAENSALALSETANLLMIPGRLCENGKAVPVEREDYRMFATQLIDAGKTAQMAARSKNLDAMVDAAGVITVACAACHDVYRDRSDVDRCTP